MEERLLDDLSKANTELNTVAAERDHLVRICEQTNKKLSDLHAAKEDLKSQMHQLKEDNAALRHKIQELQRENKELAYFNTAWDQSYKALQKTHDELLSQVKPAAPAPPTLPHVHANRPERPRSPHRSPGRKEAKEERARRSEQESREKKAEKERLSRRFDEKRPAPRDRRHSFVEQWGPGPGPGPGPAAPCRPYADVQLEAVPPSHGNGGFSSVPRTATGLSGAMYKPRGGGHRCDEGREDGNYHMYPVAR